MNKEIKLLEMRDAIRFLVVIFTMPWLGDITEFLFEYELKFEVELVITAMYFIFGSFWCGWLCPFGNTSYFVTRIGEKLFPSLQFKIPYNYAKPLRYLKYVFLIMFIYALYETGHSYFFGDHGELYDSTPYTALFSQVKVHSIFLIPLFIPRFFCIVLCPQKALYNIINKIVPSAYIFRDTKKCINCKKCDNVCPMSLNVSTKEVTKGSSDCISCYACIEKGCPKKVNALSIRYFNKEITPLNLASIALIVYILATGIMILLDPRYLEL